MVRKSSSCGTTLMSDYDMQRQHLILTSLTATKKQANPVTTKSMALVGSDVCTSVVPPVVKAKLEERRPVGDDKPNLHREGHP